MPHAIEDGLLESYKLETEIHGKDVTQDEMGQTNTHQVDWDWTATLGWGSFGVVHKQKRRGGSFKEAETFRAVKIIGKQRMEYKDLDYKREIEAMAALDRSRVRDIPIQAALCL